MSPLETAAAPLEKYIEEGKPKLDQVEYLNRCETPKFSNMIAFNESYVSIYVVNFDYF